MLVARLRRAWIIVVRDRILYRRCHCQLDRMASPRTRVFVRGRRLAMIPLAPLYPHNVIFSGASQRHAGCVLNRLSLRVTWYARHSRAVAGLTFPLLRRPLTRLGRALRAHTTGPVKRFGSATFNAFYHARLNGAGSATQRLWT